MTLDALAQKYITGNILRSLPKREFGKYMSHPAEALVKEELEKLGVTVFSEGEGKASAGHYDLYTDSNYRIQVKFRSVDGVTPVSKQIYLHNWRQKLQYDLKDFECIIFVICHKDQREPSDWIWCFVKSEDLIDPEDSSKMLQNVPTSILKEGLDWKSKFLEDLSKNSS